MSTMQRHMLWSEDLSSMIVPAAPEELHIKILAIKHIVLNKQLADIPQFVSYVEFHAKNIGAALGIQTMWDWDRFKPSFNKGSKKRNMEKYLLFDGPWKSWFFNNMSDPTPQERIVGLAFITWFHAFLMANVEITQIVSPGTYGIRIHELAKMENEQEVLTSDYVVPTYVFRDEPYLKAIPHWPTSQL